MLVTGMEIYEDSGEGIAAGDITLYYKYFTATCRVEYDGYVTAVRNCGPKGKGFAKKLLEGICEHADMMGRTLLLDAYPYADKALSRPQLVKMYKKVGFRFVGTRVEGRVRMERKPVLRLTCK